MNSSCAHFLHFILFNREELTMKLVAIYFLSLLVLVGCGLVKFQPIPDAHNDDSHIHDSNSTNNSTSNPTNNPQVVAPNNLVTYTIVNGQGNAPWGSPLSPIKGVVGQVLRIINNDIVAHAIHTINGAPFDHTNDIAPGATINLMLEKPITTTATNPLTWKHNSNPIIPIYFAITPKVTP